MSDTTDTDATIDEKMDATIKLGDRKAYAHLRRSVYCFGVTGVSLLGMLAIGFRGGNDQVSIQATQAFSGIVTWIASIYLCVSAVDRSGVLSHIGEALKTRAGGG